MKAAGMALATMSVTAIAISSVWVFFSARMSSNVMIRFRLTSIYQQPPCVEMTGAFIRRSSARPRYADDVVPILDSGK
jgi:hypothetical protein